MCVIYVKVEQIYIFYANYYEASILFLRPDSEQTWIYLHAFLLPYMPTAFCTLSKFHTNIQS